MNIIVQENFICPECEKAFVLRGAKLRVFKNNKSKNSELQGPFCCYQCSGKFNARNARLAQAAGQVIKEVRAEF